MVVSIAKREVEMRFWHDELGHWDEKAAQELVLDLF